MAIIILPSSRAFVSGQLDAINLFAIMGDDCGIDGLTTGWLRGLAAGFLVRKNKIWDEGANQQQNHDDNVEGFDHF